MAALTMRRLAAAQWRGVAAACGVTHSSDAAPRSGMAHSDHTTQCCCRKRKPSVLIPEALHCRTKHRGYSAAVQSKANDSITARQHYEITGLHLMGE